MPSSGEPAGSCAALPRDGENPEEAKRLAIGEGECNMRIEWDAGDVVDGTVEAVDAYVLKEEDG